MSREAVHAMLVSVWSRIHLGTLSLFIHSISRVTINVPLPYFPTGFAEAEPGGVWENRGLGQVLEIIFFFVFVFVFCFAK